MSCGCEGGEGTNLHNVTINESCYCENSGFLERTVEPVAIHSLQTADLTAGLEWQTCGYQINNSLESTLKCDCTHSYLSCGCQNGVGNIA